MAIRRTGSYDDLLRLPDGHATRLTVRSMEGLLPLCATAVIEPWQREGIPRTVRVLTDQLQRMPGPRESSHPIGSENQVLLCAHLHADDGAGVGASARPGWTAFVASLWCIFGGLDARTLPEAGKRVLERRREKGEGEELHRVASQPESHPLH